MLTLKRAVIALWIGCVLCCGDSSDEGGPGPDAGFTQFDAAIAPGEEDAASAEPDGSLPGSDAAPQADASVVPGVPDAAAEAGTPDAALSDAGSTTGNPVFVAVGYSGRRVRSLDLGLTWVDDQSLGGSGDDENLLRAVAFGRGLFVAVGWKILTSPDGRTWTDRTMTGQQWLGGIQYGNQTFVATGGYGTSARSADGLSWSPGGSLGIEASRSLAFGNGMFVSATDQGNWWSSTDGQSWPSVISGGHDTQVAYCGGTFMDANDCSGTFSARARAVGEGVTIRAENGGLQRSTDGVNFSPVLSGGASIEAVAFGYVEARP